MNNTIKITLSILLFLCLADMPYAYLIIYGALALLFQSFFKIALGRELWNVVDVLVGIGLIVSVFVDKKGGEDVKFNCTKNH